MPTSQWMKMEAIGALWYEAWRSWEARKRTYVRQEDKNNQDHFFTFNVASNNASEQMSSHQPQMTGKATISITRRRETFTTT